MSNTLRSGYTTGTHATAVVLCSLYEFFNAKELVEVEVVLPSLDVAKIQTQKEKKLHYSTIKVDNDDLDVTKGAKIFAKLYKKRPSNLKEQQPSIVVAKDIKLFVWAGDGVGVVTKEGLKIPPTYPAINPTPLLMMQTNIEKLFKDKEAILHLVIGVEDGEKIALNTANAKVGVLGGISILGTRGIVKPISAIAYIESIKAEVNVASKNSETVVFTLGNSAYDKAIKLYEEVSVVEIGNFVFDAVALLAEYDFKKIVFITSVAKMTKVAQGFKNTHNRFGSIAFEKIFSLLEELGHKESSEVVTLKAILDSLDDELKYELVKKITQEAVMQLSKWKEQSGVKCSSLEVLTLPYDIKEELRW